MLPIQHPQFGVNPGHCVGGTGPTIQEAELTKERTRPQEGQRDFLPALRCNSQLYLAGLNEVVQALAEGRISDRRAGRVLFDLQQVSAAIRRRYSGRK